IINTCTFVHDKESEVISSRSRHREFVIMTSGFRSVLGPFSTAGIGNAFESVFTGIAIRRRIHAEQIFAGTTSSFDMESGWTA
ncbi:hypothetical protein, partial [Turicibacter bilis]|uniref:hypothetical protein n=1 Tax=Turicibacter bilis TaxID=2735723 RepID=UPI0031BABCD9